MPKPAPLQVPAPQPDRVLRLPDVIAMCGLRRAAVYAAMAAERFPRPVRLSARAVGWRLSDLQRWLAEREAA